MKAMVSPLLTLNDISFNKYSSASGYLKETFLNSIVPTSLVISLSIVPSGTETIVSNTSLIRLAETLALGKIINIMASIRKDIITCIA